MIHSVYLRENCKHEAYRPIVMLGRIVQWRCRCGRIVAEPHMSNRVASYITILQQLAVELRKRKVMPEEKLAAYASGLHVCRDKMDLIDEAFINRVESEFSCLRAKVTE